MFKGFLIWILLGIVSSAIEKGYTLYHLKEYSDECFGQNDNTSHVMIGTYLHTQGRMDALSLSDTPYSFGINLIEATRGKTKYSKVFGSGENYDQLMSVQPQIVANDINNNNEFKEGRSYVVIDWDQRMFQKPEQKQIQYIGWLQKLLVAVPHAILKFPAHYVCKTVGGTPFHKHINHSSYILEMYGREDPYLTYQQIFSKTDYDGETDGYTSDCPKNPSTIKLKSILDKAKFNIQKTLHTEYVGYVGEMDEWIEQAAKDDLFSGVVFFDQHPRNTIRI